VAAGLACGAAVSFLPLPGLHFFLGALMALLLRGSLIASTVGTIVGNPWTFPFIWLAGYRIGDWMGVGGGADVGAAGLGARLGEVFRDVWNGQFASAAIESWPVLAPTLLGGAILGAVAGAVAYGGTRLGVTTYKARRKQRLAAGRARWRRNSAAVAEGGSA